MAVEFFHEALRSWVLNPLPSIAYESGLALLLNYLRLVSPALAGLEENGVPLSLENACGFKLGVAELAQPVPKPVVWAEGFGRDYLRDVALAEEIVAAVNFLAPGRYIAGEGRYIAGSMRLSACMLHNNVVVTFFHI